ncbi:chorismate mutase, clade 2 [Thiovulum sp. ES]|nr:chorismate mutase, clade 2 [Thiovulum sp. ES]
MKLSEIRVEIDKIDDELLTLVNKRMEFVKLVGELKHKNKSAIYRPEREKEIIKRLQKQNLENSGLLKDDGIEALFLELFSVARNLERPEKIAYLGPDGSFTHQVAESRFGAVAEYLPMKAIKDVVNTVETGGAKYGVVPIENSSNGIVGETFDLLESTDLKIIAEVYIPVHHSFVSKCNSLSDIKRIYSKDIAFKQCENFLEAHNLGGVQLIPVESTARAAYLSSNDENSGAICSSIASRLYNIPILFENIEDSKSNKTRFIILSDSGMGRYDGGKTSIIVKFDDDDESGSLYRFLKGFSEKGINLSRIQSRPIRDKHFRYSFFIDFDGDIRNPEIAEIVSPYKDKMKWLGTYVGNN